MKRRVVYLFTDEFPFGRVTETFLEAEIIYLAKEFDKVILFPRQQAMEKRKVPENVEVDTSFCDIKSNKIEKLKALLFHLFLFIRIVFSEIAGKGLTTVWRNKKVLLDILGQEIILSKVMQNRFKDKVNDAIFYTYWFCSSTLAVSILKRRNKQMIFISRIHGYDLYDERWGETGVPFRNWKMRYIDKVYSISEHGKKYILSKIPSSFSSKIALSYLGVRPLERRIKSPIKDKKTKVIISISRIVSLKRIELIPQILKHIQTPIHWIHFGGGDKKITSQIEKIGKQLPSNISYELKGEIKNKDLLNELCSNNFDLFISTSSSEGLPVSMMEAQSVGIPIVSFPVGGVPEIVKEGKTGFLFLEGDEIQNAEILRKALDYSFNSEEIISYYHSHFNADINYASFAEELRSYVN